jgi:TolA-binding protein
MAQPRKQDLLSKLADRGEQVVGRITDLPGAKALIDQAAGMTKRMDDVQRRLRALDPLEKRVTALERRLDQLEGKGTKARSTGTKRTTGTKRASSAAKPRSTTRRTTGRRGTGGSSSGSGSGS